MPRGPLTEKLRAMLQPLAVVLMAVLTSLMSTPLFNWVMRRSITFGARLRAAQWEDEAVTA